MPAPPYSAGKMIPMQPELAEMLDRLAGKLRRFVPLHYIRQDLARGEIAHGFAQVLLLICELKIQLFVPFWKKTGPSPHEYGTDMYNIDFGGSKGWLIARWEQVFGRAGAEL